MHVQDILLEAQGLSASSVTREIAHSHVMNAVLDAKYQNHPGCWNIVLQSNVRETPCVDGSIKIQEHRGQEQMAGCTYWQNVPSTQVLECGAQSC